MQLNNPISVPEIFGSHRATIEAAASARFDANGVDEGDFGGKPILTLRPEDLQAAEIEFLRGDASGVRLRHKGRSQNW
jgi:hypothetical protein